MKLHKLIPATSIALTTFGSLDNLADSNSSQTSTYLLYCPGNSGNSWYHPLAKKSGGHYHSCDNSKFKNDSQIKGDPKGARGSTFHYCSATKEGAANGTCSKN